MAFPIRGFILDHEKRYTKEEQSHLVKTIGECGGNVLSLNNYAWKTSYEPLEEKEALFLDEISTKGRKYGVKIWVGMRPGDRRYCMHECDRENFVKKAKQILTTGVDGIFIHSDDTHGGRIEPADALHHSAIINETHEATGKVKAVCLEEYSGKLIGTPYFDNIHIPKEIPICWTGINGWSKEINAVEVPRLENKVIIWDNYYASDSPKPEHAPAAPYTGRQPGLDRVTAGLMLNLNDNYAWQYPAIRMSAEYMKDTISYDPQRSFRETILAMGERNWDLSHEEDLKIIPAVLKMLFAT